MSAAYGRDRTIRRAPPSRSIRIADVRARPRSEPRIDRRDGETHRTTDAAPYRWIAVDRPGRIVAIVVERVHEQRHITFIPQAVAWACHWGNQQ
ncbi:hypothetical protein IEQ11_22225 [Lysobacter capsici]|uniref:hypothetical protein n=1 Tax=Lysobacter capsici TaxID=435897 RepID=UPI0017810697|nr:hypothetical protein [Lysobacter capsici]UOF14406.1 hypothetical protein IEQ11_22225 [Lysobacter capsici]